MSHPLLSGRVGKIEKKTVGNTLELLVPGRIDNEAAHQLEIAITDAIQLGVQAVYLDLSRATFLCSSGIRVLLKYHRTMNDKGRKLRVVRPAPDVAAALDLTGLATYLLVRTPTEQPEQK